MKNVLGTLEAGKLADLVIVDRDPCTDLRHLREIAYVVKGGLVGRSLLRQRVPGVDSNGCSIRSGVCGAWVRCLSLKAREPDYNASLQEGG
jgi:hypothetical protein